MSSDPFDLARFVQAQAPVWEAVCAQLRAGRKRTHWMWFVFPQSSGLGTSETARFYAIASLDEAIAYLRHPTLGPRLLFATGLLNDLPGSDAQRILGGIDAMKLHACMTLFARADPAEPVFRTCLRKYFADAPHAATLALL